MKYKKILLLLTIIGIVAIGSFFTYKIFFRKKQQELYTTQLVEKRTIAQVIKATGYLRPVDMMNIGSLVAGIIHKMHVEENATVKKGQLLVEVDDGKGDTEVREAQAALDRAQALATYQKVFFKRQKALYKDNHISLDRFEQVERDLRLAQADVDRTQATYDKIKRNYDNKWITSPDDGLVINKTGSEGETVTLSSPPTIIYTIAKDITNMEAKINIDESVVGDLTVGMTAEFTLDTYPYQLFSGTISDISNAAIIIGGATNYIATIPIDNSEQLFRPTMHIDAEIAITKKEEVVAVPGYAFALNRTILKEIAKGLGYQFNEIDEERREELRKKSRTKTIWVEKENAFIEKIITIGISDSAYFEVISGLKATETIIIDTVEPDIMEQFFKRLFGGGGLQ